MASWLGPWLRRIMSLRPAVSLAAIVFVGVLFRLLVATTLAIDGDEGQFIYQSHRALEGAVPLRDLLPPAEPLYVWLVAVVQLFLGPTLFAIRLLSVLFGIVAMIGMYLLAKELATTRIALLASLIYATSPTIILYNSIGIYRQIAYPMIIIAFYFLVVGLKKQSAKPLLAFGATVGLAILTYRITGIFLVTVPLLLLRLGSVRKVARLLGAIALGTLAANLPVLAYLVSLSDDPYSGNPFGSPPSMSQLVSHLYT